MGVVCLLAMPLVTPILGTTVALAATAQETEGLTITSDRMELDDKQQTAIFSGDVRAEEKRIRLTANKMTVTYQKGGRRVATAQKTGVRGGVSRIRAEGRVVLLQGESRGTADEMIYQVESQTLEMLGQTQNATIHHGSDHLEGKRIFLTIGEDHAISKISVQGGEQRRVSARITPTEETDGKAGNQRSPLQPPPKAGKPLAKQADEP